MILQDAPCQMTLGSKTVKRWSTDMLERGQAGGGRSQCEFHCSVKRRCI